MTSPGRSQSSGGLFNDWVVRLMLASYVVVVAPYLLPGLSQATLSAWGESPADSLLLLVTLIALCWGFPAREPNHSRLFRRLLTAALGILLLSNAVLSLKPETEWWSSCYRIASVYALFAFYFLMLVALAVQPHREDHGEPRNRLRFVRPLGTIILLFGVLNYFVGIPVAQEWEGGPTDWIPALLCYLALDVVLLIVAIRERRIIRDPDWRRIYGYLVATFLAFSLGEAADLASHTGLLPWVDSGSIVDLAWCLYYIPLILAARCIARLTAHPPTKQALQPDNRTLLRAMESWQWLAYALSLPCLHLILELSGTQDPQLRVAREILVLLFALGMGAAAWFHERLLRRENRQLENERGLALDQLQAARRLEGLGRLAAGIAHEFNNKLTVINGTSEMLTTQLAKDDNRRRLAEEILETGNRAATVVSQLLAFSRRQVCNPRVLDLNDEVTHLIVKLRHLLGQDISIEERLGRKLPAVEVDPGHLEQILLNLTTNARDAMPDGGILSISTELVPATAGSRSPQHQELLLTVRDNGSGMSQRARERAFEPFFTTKATGRGTGLGLATVLGLMQQNRGHVGLDSQPGLGTTIRLFLPASNQRPSQKLLPVDLEPREIEPACGRVLLVEDELRARSFIRRTLEQEGYTVVEAGTGKAALESLEDTETAFDYLVTDVVMPGMSGPDLAEAVAQIAPGIRTLFISGFERDCLPPERLVHATGFLQKPFQIRDLLAALRDLDHSNDNGNTGV